MAKKSFGFDSPCFIIAEAGVNHNGDPEVAKELVDVAVDAGVDAVKFQMFNSDRLVTLDVDVTNYQRRSGYTNQYEMLKSLELTSSQFEDIVEYCKRCGIEFLSTPYDRESVSALESFGVDRIKIASADIINKPLLKKVADSGTQVILSSGMASIEEIGQALGWLNEFGNENIVLLHCVSEYPTNPRNLNLKFIKTLRTLFDIPVGFSDHTLGITAPVAAVALGAKIVEKHYTLDTNMEGPDHEASLEPDELQKMVSSIRTCEETLGNPIKQITDEERANSLKMRASLHTAIDLSGGDCLTEERVVIARPANGLEPRFLESVLGRRIKEDIKAGEPLNWEIIT